MKEVIQQVPDLEEQERQAVEEVGMVANPQIAVVVVAVAVVDYRTNQDTWADTWPA